MQLFSTPAVIDAYDNNFTVKVVEPIAVRLVQDDIIVHEITANVQQIYNVAGFQSHYSVPIEFFNGMPLVTEALRTDIALEFEFFDTPAQHFLLEIRLSSVQLQWRHTFTEKVVTIPFWNGALCNYVNGVIISS
jgi:hypothetical protein